VKARAAIALLLLLGVSAGAQGDMMQEAAEMLTKFLRIADSPKPKTGRECRALIRPARVALEDFKGRYPDALPEIIKELESAGFTLDQGCTTLDRFGNLTLWAAAVERIFKADDMFYRISQSQQPPGSTPPPAPAPAPASQPPATATTAPPPAAPPPSAAEDAGALLSKFFLLADSKPPGNQEKCLDLVRPAQQQLAAFRTNHPNELTEMVEALERAHSGYDQACRRQHNASAWASASESVRLADELLAKHTGSTPRAAAPASSRPAGAAAPGQAAADPRAVERAREILDRVQKLDSVVDLALGKEEIQNRLIEAHAGLQEFASTPESEALPLTVANLRLAIAYYRRRLDAEDSFALASAKEALQKARGYLQSYIETGREEPDKP